ncbi:hypothetical protein BDV93DRAFT_608359 [Ceratobasidium sp. AG-I]|nr:hypothetical protein BDV93DRAFT_608359 [Ceratobasidium sp. AG-I]
MSILLDMLVCVGLIISVQFARMIINGLRLKAHSHMFIAQMSPLRLLFPSWTDMPGFIYGNIYTYKYKYSEYLQAGKDAYVQVSVTDPARPCFFVADPQAIKAT